MSDTAFSHFLGERNERFQMTGKLIPELERVTGAGIGTLFKRLAASQFSHSDLTHTIRLALIGGGRTPEEAARIVETFVVERPILETFPLALSILERLWYGAPVIDALVAEVTKDAAGA